MDELNFRRSLYAEPNTDDDALLREINADPKRQEFHDELKQLDEKMYQALKVEVPEDLAHKLLLRQTMQQHRVNKRRKYMHLAMAASIAFVCGVSFTLWQQQSLVDLSDQAIAHVFYEGDYPLNSQQNISLQQVNAKLAAFGGEITEDIGKIHYASICDFDNVRSLHLVVDSDYGKVTVFIVPAKDNYQTSGAARRQGYSSQAADLHKASLIVVGEDGTNVKEVKEQLSQRIQFST